MKDATETAWSRCLAFAARSDIGLRRANNQDSYTTVLADSQADFEQRGHFFMVADGMGAHAAGELASKMATDVVALVYRKRLAQSPPEALLSALQDANGQIHTRGQASPDFRGMGTTATAMVLLPTGAIVAHVGDSRAYRHRGTQIEQLTFDHSLVWEIRAASPSANVELPSHISKNIITRSLGPNESVQIDLEGPYPFQPGDTFLLCSDGLSGQVKDDEIGLIMGLFPPEEAAQALVDLANLRGGPDNITVVVVRVLDSQIAQATESNCSSGTAPSAAKPIHPVVWTVTSVVLLASLGLFFVGRPLFAVLGILVAIGLFITAVSQRSSHENRDLAWDGRQLGRGPHVVCECIPTAELVSRSAEGLQRLHEGPLKECATFEWSEADAMIQKAESALQAGELSDAARQYLQAVGNLMAQLRRFRHDEMPDEPK